MNSGIRAAVVWTAGTALVVLALLGTFTPGRSRPARAEAPAGHYTTDADVVLDNGTGLHWQRGDDGTTRTWADAQTYCQALALPGSGWRMPSVKELQSLYDETAAGGGLQLDRTAFPDAATTPYWTSSATAQSAASAWTFGFSSSRGMEAASKDSARVVRCVH